MVLYSFKPVLDKHMQLQCWNNNCIYQRITTIVVFVFICFNPAFSDTQSTPAQIPFNEMGFINYLTGNPDDVISMPTDVAVNDYGVYIVDGGNHRIVVHGVDGEFRKSFGGKGNAAGQFHDPVGLGLDTQGNIYVADRGNRRIQKFDKNGTFTRQFPVKSAGTDIRPIDVDISQDGKEIYVTGNRNHKIMVFDQFGKLLREWGGNGLNPGQFRYPGSIKVFKDGRIAAVDILNTRVQVFESSGVMAIEISGWGVLPGQLVRPKGVAEGHNGTFYISDSYMDVVQVFSQTGILNHVLKPDSPEHKLVAPAGISIDIRTGRIFVAEVLKNRVAVFKLPL